MNKKELRGKIIGRFGTQERFAKDVLGISGSTLSTKMCSGSFTLKQVMQITAALDLSADEVMAFFFTDDVGKKSNTEA